MEPGSAICGDHAVWPGSARSHHSRWRSGDSWRPRLVSPASCRWRSRVLAGLERGRTFYLEISELLATAIDGGARQRYSVEITRDHGRAPRGRSCVRGDQAHWWRPQLIGGARQNCRGDHRDRWPGSARSHALAWRSADSWRPQFMIFTPRRCALSARRVRLAALRLAPSAALGRAVSASVVRRDRSSACAAPRASIRERAHAIQCAGLSRNAFMVIRSASMRRCRSVQSGCVVSVCLRRAA